jgi:hypothetical protein
MRVDLTAIQVRAIVTNMRDHFAEDEQFLLDTLEGETDLFELLTKLLDGMERDDGDIASLTEQMATRKERRDRAEARKASRREAIQALLEATGRDKLTLPEATLSIRKVPPKPVVSDAEALPLHLCRIKRTPDMAAIKAEMGAGAAVPGVTLDNGGLSLTIRRS